jgi:hypothetical protein
MLDKWGKLGDLNDCVALFPMGLWSHMVTVSWIANMAS